MRKQKTKSLELILKIDNILPLWRPRGSVIPNTLWRSTSARDPKHGVPPRRLARLKKQPSFSILERRANSHGRAVFRRPIVLRSHVDFRGSSTSKDRVHPFLIWSVTITSPLLWGRSKKIQGMFWIIRCCCHSSSRMNKLVLMIRGN